MFAGERVRLRGLQESDIDDLAGMEVQAEAVRLRRQGPIWPGGRAEAEALYERTRTAAPDRISFAIEAIDDGRFVGHCVLATVSRTHRSAEIGIGLLEEDTGRGYGGEALRLLLEYAFAGMLLHRVHALVRADDERGIAAFTAAGLKLEARLREEALDLDGNRVDVLSVSVLHDEWREAVA
ncbi:MAG TPA: GNAT family protein [Nitriliruptorales bacterium]